MFCPHERHHPSDAWSRMTGASCSDICVCACMMAVSVLLCWVPVKVAVGATLPHHGMLRGVHAFRALLLTGRALAMLELLSIFL